jgi:predicted transcriptional regulator
MLDQIHEVVKVIKEVMLRHYDERMTKATAEFVEGFALVLNRAGMQRMGSRVFAALLAAEEDGLTAKEIGDTLGVSPAAVSGAVNYLTSTGLAGRRRVPGTRVDRFVVESTQWAEAIATETDRLRELSAWLAKGAAAVPSGSPTHLRLSETQAFFDFLVIEMPKLVERWREQRDSTPPKARRTTAAARGRRTR